VWPFSTLFNVVTPEPKQAARGTLKDATILLRFFPDRVQ
jgi:hypothetical protein